MLRKLLYGLGLIFCMLVLVMWRAKSNTKPNEQVILDFINNNRMKSAIKFVRNDSVFAMVNEGVMMPLASTVKIILAIEYAEQAAEGIVDADEMIALGELDEFYVPNTDGGAHPRWLRSIKQKSTDGNVSIRDIAKGMIKYSSNANTEWLCHRLGLANVNSRLTQLGVERHSEIYYIVSALFLGKERFSELQGEELEEALRGLSSTDYIAVTKQVHQKLLVDTNYRKEVGDLSMNIQRVWSDSLPRSTVEEYVGIMEKINSRRYFDEGVQELLDEVMEYILENPVNRTWLEHSGMKGGSTAFVLTKALYATDKKGNKTELAYFFNDLTKIENRRLRKHMNQFELRLLNSRSFREKLQKTLSN